MTKIIVSGVSRGIGRALAGFYLSQPNNEVFGISRDPVALNEIQEHLSSSGSQFVPVHLNLGNPDEYSVLTDLLQKHGTKADVLINNAGKMLYKPFASTDVAAFDEVININLRAPYFLTRALLPFFAQGAHVLNITSMGGMMGSVKFPGLSAYSAGKGGLSILTEILAEELKPFHISVNALALGAVQTEMLEEAFPGYKAPVTSGEMAEYIGNFALSGHRFFNGKVLPVSSSTP